MLNFYLQFTLTNSCNQACSYCDLSNYHKNTLHEVEADLDYFKWIINVLPSDHLFIELSGGEPGLVSNLDHFIDFLQKHPNVKRIQLMSNGLVRLKNPSTIDKVDSYNEHIISNINGTEINKFYDLNLKPIKNGRYIVVLSEQNTESILLNYQYFNQLGFFNEDNFCLKNYVDRLELLTQHHKSLLIQLFTLIDSNYSNYSINQLQSIDKLAQKVCSKISWQPVINLENRKIIHCAYHNFSNQIEYDCNEENLKKLINKELFIKKHPTYCDKCHLYFTDWKFLMKNNKANRYDISNRL